MSDERVIDVTEEVKKEIVSGSTVLAQRKGVNCLILKKCERRERLDGKWGTCILEHRWFKTPETDVHSPLGQEFTIWTRNEVRDVLSGKVGMFDFFDING